MLSYEFQEMFGTISEFMKLERIEIGGIKGKVLSQQVLQLFEEFQTVFREFTRNTYDCLDPMNLVSDTTLTHKGEGDWSFFIHFPHIICYHLGASIGKWSE